MKIFISWSGEKGYAVAVFLAEWIPSVIQAVETYVSPEDVRQGTGWADEVPKEIDRSSFGILCLVPGGIGAPWLNFEAGVLSRSMDASKMISLLVGVERSELVSGPLAQFPSAVFDRNDMYRLVETVNGKTGIMGLGEERLRNTFELWWPKLERDVHSLMSKGNIESKTTVRSEKLPDVGERAKGAERPAQTARKSETRKTLDADKSARPAAARPELEEIEIEMLNVLYEAPGQTPVTAAAVGFKLGISAQKARERLDNLERSNFVREHLFVGRPKEYSLAPKGREYLTRKDPSSKRQPK